MDLKKWLNIRFIDFIIIGFIFMVLFLMPVMFTKINGQISWLHVIKLWQDLILLFPVFILNHWVLAPQFMFRKKYFAYVFCILGIIGIFTSSYYYVDEVVNAKPIENNSNETNRPKPIPPYAHLLMYSLMIVGVDTGLLVSKKWHEIEEKKVSLEKENTEMQLDILRNQISPHFFMNTLNNIYALVDYDTPKAKQSIMQLSKLMRYMLYESENGKVKLSKEFEFIRSYINLMKLRFADDVDIQLVFPENFEGIVIPPMLFTTYIENAFKYGASYQNPSFIHIFFEISNKKICFNCCNSRHVEYRKTKPGGLGMKNNENRLMLLYGSEYSLAIMPTEKTYDVSLTIPI